MITKKTILVTSLMGGLFLNAQAYSAAAIQFEGTTPVQTEIKTPHLLRGMPGNNSQNTAPKTQTVYLQKITLSPEMQEIISQRVDKQLAAAPDNNAANDQSSVYLGMNDVPVLNQGQFGTCATFATTAAIDAFIARTPRDYISPMCNLELGNYLHAQDRNYPSGWQGSFGTLILQQMTDYGIVSNANCPDPYGMSGKKATKKLLTLDQFNQTHEMVMQNIPYKTLVSPFKNNRTMNTDEILELVKTSLRNGHRVLIGSAIVDNVDGDGAGVNATYHSNYRDAWVLSTATAKGLKRVSSGHEMVITGFDDNAVAVEVEKNPKKMGGPNKDGKHQGLLILRNSWGNYAGDNGDYYMSYDFFKAAVTELNEVG